MKQVNGSLAGQGAEAQPIQGQEFQSKDASQIHRCGEALDSKKQVYSPSKHALASRLPRV